MAVCLDYQSVYQKKSEMVLSTRVQITAAVLLLLALTAKVWIKIESTDLGYQLGRERQQTVVLDEQRRELELQLSVMLRSDNLARAARQRLGLVQLNPMQARRLDMSQR